MIRSKLISLVLVLAMVAAILVVLVASPYKAIFSASVSSSYGTMGE